MSQENVDLVRGGYDDFNSGNVEGVLERLDPEVAWTEPGGGNSPSGTFTGPQSVGADVFAKVPEQFDEFSCTVEDARDEGDTVVVSARFAGRNKAEPSWTRRPSTPGRFATARSCGSSTSRPTRTPGPRPGAEPPAGQTRSCVKTRIPRAW